MYAFNIVGGRWPKAEPFIMKDPQWAYWYALNILKGVWPEAEQYIKDDPQWWGYYNRDLKGKGHLSEQLQELESNDVFTDDPITYIKEHPEDKQRALEIIKQDPGCAYYYARHEIHGRWPEAESFIKKDPAHAYLYAYNIIKGRWPEAEPYIMRNAYRAYQYARWVIRGRWTEAEPIIKNSRWIGSYEEFVLARSATKTGPHISDYNIPRHRL
jgi:hypothetical protein